jgi:hypothetical protein
MKIHSVGAEFFHVGVQMDGRTVTHEANESFFGSMRKLKKKKKIKKVGKQNVREVSCRAIT